MADDALNQYVALVYRLSKVGPDPARSPGLDAYLKEAASLGADDGWNCLNQLKLWLASFPAPESAKFITKIVELGGYCRTQTPQTLRQVYKLNESVNANRNRGATSIARRAR